MLDKDFSDLTPAVIPESQDFENLQEIRKFVGEKLPDPNRLENISDLDDLMLAQLRENVERCDAAHYLNTQGDYELPCEFKRVDEEFYFFIPRVTDWQYIRATPFDANHSPFLETYSGKDHDFAKAFERIMGIIPYHFIGGHPSTKIGLEGEKDMTRYHHIKLTQDGLEITLLSTPNVYQVEKLQSLQARLREKGIKIDIKYEIRDHGVALPQAQEHALMVEIPNTPINLSVNYESTKPHEFDVDESGRVIVISNSLPNNSEYIYGYGYQNSQMYYGTYDRQGINSLSFYFEPTARNHGQAMSGLMLDKVCEQRNQNSVRTLQETRKDLEGSLVEETEVLEDKWTYRYDILKKNTTLHNLCSRLLFSLRFSVSAE